MFRDILASCAMLFLGLCCGGCNRAAQPQADSDYPSVPPIWIVEDDPKVTIFDRKDLEHDRRVGKMLVIPVYVNYQHDSATDNVAIAHPFVYQQGEDIEKQLGLFPQRENLESLVFWVPGYFPDSMGRTFPWVPIINGKQMVVVELQRCLGSEQSQIDAAMKTLLEGDFVVGGMIQLQPPPPPYSNEPKMSNDTYDASQLVRSGKYTGRFFVFEAAWSRARSLGI